MPHYAYLETDLTCPHCREIISDIVWFQWGYSPGYGPQEEHLYHIGDAITWKACENGEILSWVYFSEHGGANLGDPEYKNLIIKDPAQYHLHEACERCGGPLGGAVVELKEGIIHNARITLPGELEEEANEFLILEGGKLKPMYEWIDHPMTIVKNCE
jgi:hypothetical protein